MNLLFYTSSPLGLIYIVLQPNYTLHICQFQDVTSNILIHHILRFLNVSYSISPHVRYHAFTLKIVLAQLVLFIFKYQNKLGS